ncbi:MAG: WbqC family protein [Candidatus Edwardsbacteria bacterium]|jgi:hypothetical protein|nr:WbqC family protein [Candidatus Edwardsbacteria bacterium]
MNKLAVMQPYFFPYLGYFQLVRAADTFVFYDDVNFIKNGWINRNRILIDGAPHYLTVQLKNASSFSPINRVEFTDNRGKLLKTIQQAYQKAPFFGQAWPVVEDCLRSDTTLIGELAMRSVTKVSHYLGIDTSFQASSSHAAATKGLEKTGRLVEICRLNGATDYINPIGGRSLYRKEDFAGNGIRLSFIRSKDVRYRQNCPQFVPDLSIIDVIMFNSREAIGRMLNEHELI